MKCNVGNTDKIIRVVVGLIAAYLGFAVNPWFYVVTVITLVTVVVGFCPVSKLLGTNTCKTKEHGVVGGAGQGEAGSGQNEKTN